MELNEHYEIETIGTKKLQICEILTIKLTNTNSKYKLNYNMYTNDIHYSRINATILKKLF